MGTVNGADALGLFRGGELRVGAYAGLAIIDLPDDDASDPHELLFDPRSRVRSVITPGP
jgi:cytosine/adenosine deaminase-related metal-dependent hydrolase